MQKSDEEINKAIETTLVEKIQRLESQVALLNDQLQTARDSSIAIMLGQLRLREALLVYTGVNADDFSQQLIKVFGKDIESAVSRHLFILNNAPIPENTRKSMRIAFDRGMTRW